MKYQNPIIKGFNPDPSICFDGTYFYLVTSSFEFFPGVPIYRSRNLVNWELVGHCLTDKTQCNMTGARCSHGIFAPTIRYHDGIYYMVTTNVSNGGNFIVHTTDPCGKWSEPVYIARGGIDPSLLFDDGKVYFVNANDGISMLEINPLTGEQYTKPITISRGSGGKYPEGPHVYKIGEYFYLLVAEGGTAYCHMETVFRSKTPYGPYEPCPHNPILTHRDSYDCIQCTGHADMVEDKNGNWWLVFLGIRAVNGLLHNLGRETFLAPIEWKDGWPSIGESKMVGCTMEGEFPAPVEAVNFDFTDSFTDNTRKLPWTFIRNPKEENFCLKDGYMQLTGEGIGLDNEEISPVFMGIRQTEFRTRTCVDMEMVSDDIQAGIAAYHNAYYYYALFIEKENGAMYAVLEKHLHDEKCISSRIRIDMADTVSLRMETDSAFYHFYVTVNDSTYYVGKGSIAGLCTEGTMMMTFTGTFVGLVSTRGTANFRSFRYAELTE